MDASPTPLAIVQVYIPTKNLSESKKICTALLKKKLIACGNIIDTIHSLYVWDGSLQDTKESLLLCKTTIDRVEEIESTVKELHSYDCPCIATIPLLRVNDDYRAWAVGQLQ